MKCLSGVLVNMHGAALHIAPSASSTSRHRIKTNVRDIEAAHAQRSCLSTTAVATELNMELPPQACNV